MEKIIFLDTETTSADPKTADMIQLGYIICDMDFNEIKRENLFFKNNNEKISFWAMAVHHITPEILEENLRNDERIDEEKKKQVILDFEWAYLVAHNYKFDKNVLKKNWIETEEDKWIDSYIVAYDILCDEDFRYNLQFLRYALDCKFNEVINPHDALSDVIVLKEVFKKLYFYFQNKNKINPLYSFLEITKKWIILRKWDFWKYKWMEVKKSFETDPQYFNWLYNSKISSWDTEDAVFNTLKYYLNIEKKEEEEIIIEDILI